MKKIGVLTSGGDAPGMNAAIRAVTRYAIHIGMEVVGIKRGYNGLIKGGEENLIPLDMRSVSNILQRGGTILYTARCKEFREWEGVLRAKQTCVDNGIEGVVVIGGDGSFRGAADLSKAGIACVGIPGTIDNDISMSDYTIGYDTAMNTAVEAIDKLRDTAMSHDRCSIVEVMGRGAGYIALHTGIACGASYIMTKEEPHTVEVLVERIKKTKTEGRHHFIVVVSENIGGVEELAKIVEKETGVESRATILGHIQRGGSPTVRDRVAASRLGAHAVQLLADGKAGRVVGFSREELVDYDIQQALSMTKPFENDLFEIAMKLSY
ncbi:ATP-dependent 6-phosphofructokinase [Clostridia bacterium]|nr:ATP-dependent 6-phosphofructokinase [Clostridia bacterium]